MQFIAFYIFYHIGHNLPCLIPIKKSEQSNCSLLTVHCSLLTAHLNRLNDCFFSFFTGAIKAINTCYSGVFQYILFGRVEAVIDPLAHQGSFMEAT